MSNHTQTQTHEFTLKINLNHLRAVATAMCTLKQDQYRTYLHGVHVATLQPAHPDSGQHPYRGYALEATDGHRLMRAVNRGGVSECTSASREDCPEFSFLMPYDAVQTLIKNPQLKKLDYTTITVHLVSRAEGADPYAPHPESTITLHYPGGTHTSFTLPNTTFPDTSRVTPETPPNATYATPARYDAEYLVDMEKAAVALAPHVQRRDAKRAYHVHQDGQNPALVTFAADADVYGVLMPLRVSEPGPFIREDFF